VHAWLDSGLLRPRSAQQLGWRLVSSLPEADTQLESGHTQGSSIQCRPSKTLWVPYVTTSHGGT
jgi:hypothetical protein